MIRAIGNQKLDVSSEEYQYYLELEKVFGKQSFVGLFKSDDNGQILMVMPPPSSPTAMILVFFFLNLMHNQKLRKIDSWIEKTNNKVNSLERQIDKLMEH